MDRIYLDYAASAPLSPEAVKVIETFLKGSPVGNPSSLHIEGRKMQALLDRAHTTVAAILGVHPTEVVFTSGATESNNNLIRGVIRAWRLHHEGTPHLVMSAIEHPSWRQVAKHEGADVTLIPVSTDGVVAASDVIKAIRANTVLVGCMYVNNEIGTVQPVAEIGKGVEAYREKHNSRWPIFHTDAVQAFPYCNTHSGHLHADSFTLSGHKYGALGGIGVLVLRKNMPFQSTMRGGGQEWGFRGGTENVLGAITLAAAMEHGDTHRGHLTQHAEGLQNLIESLIAQKLPKVQVLGQKVLRAPHISYLWLPGVVDEHIVHKLDLVGVSVSSGSACSSGATLPSSTLVAMGYDEREAFGGLRLSFGRGTTRAEVTQAIGRLVEVLG
ncbi:MAG TPA: cysteine desulfurase family protein [Patescibacteria group bacterium]